MAISYIQTPQGKKPILIAEQRGQYSATRWRNLINNTILQKSRLPLPNCLRTPEKQELFIAITTKSLQELGDENRWRFSDSIANSRDENQFLWDNHMSPDLFRLAAKSCNCAPIHLALAISDLMDLKPEYFFEHFPIDTKALTHFRKWEYGPIRPPLDCFTVGGVAYTPTCVDVLRDYNGEWRSAVCRYSGLAGNLFLHMSRVSDGSAIDYVSAGEVPPPAMMYGREALSDNHICPVLLSLNPDVSMALRKIQQETRSSFASSFVLLGNYGSLDALCLADLVGRDVILLCSPTHVEWELLPRFHRRCLEFGAKSVRVYPHPIIGEYCSFGNRAIPAEPREKLTADTIDLRECERLSVLAQNVIAGSFPAENLETFEKTYGLTQDESKKDSSSESSIQFQSWRSLDASDSDVTTIPTTRTFINPAYTTLIYGESDVGKSWLLMELCIALATGTEIMQLAHSIPAKIFYLDGEVGRDFASRIRQLCQDKSEAFMNLLDRNLFVRSYAESNELLGRKVEFMTLLRKERPDILVIDNILSLAPQAWCAKSEGLFDFLREIKAMGIAPIIVHHTGKKGDTYLGSVSLAALSQNIIRLENLRPKNDA